MSEPLIIQCEGEGQGECRRCSSNGKWNRQWMCFLYKIKGLDGCYCEECVEEYRRDVLREEEEKLMERQRFIQRHSIYGLTEVQHDEP